MVSYTQSLIPVLQFKLNPNGPAQKKVSLTIHVTYFGSEVRPACLMEKSIYTWTSILRKYMPLCISCRVYRLDMPVK